MTHQRRAARYADAELRSRFPHIETEILEISPFEHVIFVPADQLDALDFRETFQNSIAMAASKVNLTNDRPDKFTKIEQVDERSWGLARDLHVITRSDMTIEIEARFPSFPAIFDSEFNDDGSMTFFYAADSRHRDEPIVADFINSVVDYRKCTLEPRQPQVSSHTASDSPVHDEESMEYQPLSIRRERRTIPDFVEGAEQFWFANVGKIAAGEYVERVSEFRQADGSRAYLDAAMPTVSLRQLLLLFDEIYMQPPVEDGARGLQQFLAENHIASDDFMKLVEAGRVKLAFSQLEERSDHGFVMEVASIDRDAILSRRELGAIVLNDMARIESEFILTRPEMAPFVRKFIKDFGAEFGGAEALSQAMLFPRYAKRNWARWIEKRGAVGIEPGGQGGQFAEAFKQNRDKDIRLEAWYFGNEVHIAQALGAIYIPHTPHDSYVGSWIDPARLMANRLSFFRNFNTRFAASWAETERNKFQPDAVIRPIELFHFPDEDIIPISDFIEVTKRPSVRRKGLTLYSRMAELSSDLRDEEIKRLRLEQYKHLRRAQILSNSKECISIGTDFTMFALGNSIPPFSSGLAFITEIGRKILKIEKIDRILDHFAADLNARLGRNEDVDFLAKTSGVAKLISKK